MSEAIQPVRLLEIDFSAVAHRAMWGYGVGPPADINPHLGLVSRISARRGRHCSRRPAQAPGWCLRRSWCSWLCALAPVPHSTDLFTQNWPLWHRLCHQDCPGYGSFSAARCHRDHPEGHERSAVGASQVSKRSAETGAHRPARSRFVRGRPLHSASPSADQGGAACCPACQSKRYPDLSRVLVTAQQSRGPCVGQTLGPPVIFREPGGLSSEDGGPSKSRSKRCGEPLAPPRFRPPYVRNHCYAAAHSGTP